MRIVTGSRLPTGGGRAVSHCQLPAVVRLPKKLGTRPTVAVAGDSAGLHRCVLELAIFGGVDA